MKVIHLILICPLIIVIAIAAATVVGDWQLFNHGRLTAIGVEIRWLNGEVVTSIDWGICDNSTDKTHNPLNITSTSNSPITLGLGTGNYSANIMVLNLTWNYTAQVLQPNESIILSFTQNITVSNYEDFTYDIIVSAIQDDN